MAYPRLIKKPLPKLVGGGAIPGQSLLGGTGAAFGASMANPAIGLVTSLISSEMQKKKQKEMQQAQMNQYYGELEAEDAALLEQYPTNGITPSIYANGGGLPQSSIKGKYATIGGKSRTIGNGVEEIEGNTHEESKIDGTSGVKLLDPATGQPQAEVEDAEVVVDGDYVFSDRLTVDGKTTFAKKMKSITFKRNKIEERLEKTNDTKDRAGYERALAGFDMAEEVLKMKQEEAKVLEGEQGLNTLADGGFITDPQKPKYVPTRKDSIAVLNRSKEQKAAYLEKGYTKTKEYPFTVSTYDNLANRANRMTNKYENKRTTNVIKDGKVMPMVVSPSVYKNQIDSNTFEQREQADSYLNLDVKPSLFKSGIDPVVVESYTSADGKDIVSVPSYNTPSFEKAIYGKQEKVVNKKVPKVVPTPSVKPVVKTTTQKRYVPTEKRMDTDTLEKRQFGLTENQKQKTIDMYKEKPNIKNVNFAKIQKRNQVPKFDGGGNLPRKRKDVLGNDDEYTNSREALNSATFYNPVEGIDKTNSNILNLSEPDAIEDKTFMDSLAPSLLDNAVNLGLTMGSPKLAKPILKRAMPLKTTFNAEPQVAAIKNAVGAASDNVMANTSNSNIARANVSAVRLQGSKQLGEVYANKENIETQMKNADTMNRQGVSQGNVDTLNNQNMLEFTRANDIQSRLSGNAADLGKDINKALERKDMDTYYDEAMLLSLLDDPTGDKMRVMKRNPYFAKSKRLKGAIDAELLRKNTK